MKILIATLTLQLLTVSAFAQNQIQVKITDLSNIHNGYSMEVCGIAVHSQGQKPLLVNLTHDASSYSTLTDENGKWCQVIKRWTNKGEVTARASTLDFKEKSEAVKK